MALKSIVSAVAALQSRLNAHPVYESLRSVRDLRCFMEHHIYSVWDFMSMIKYLQSVVAPVDWPWLPRGDSASRHFINSLVLEEESDTGLPNATSAPTYTSHFELYCRAMEEVGADASRALAFLDLVRQRGIQKALARDITPLPSRRFMETTFSFIRSDRPHVVAAALALGREHIIPGMFRAFLARMGIAEGRAPTFHFYLNRHVHLDEDFHGPLSLRLVDELCGDDVDKLREARQAATEALEARIGFWDGVLEAIEAGTRRTGT